MNVSMSLSMKKVFHLGLFAFVVGGNAPQLQRPEQAEGSQGTAAAAGDPAMRGGGCADLRRTLRRARPDNRLDQEAGIPGGSALCPGGRRRTPGRCPSTGAVPPR